MVKLKQVHIQISKELEDGLNWLVNECGYNGKTSVICESIRETIRKHRHLKALEVNTETKAFDLNAIINKAVAKKLEELKVETNKPDIEKKGKPFFEKKS